MLVDRQRAFGIALPQGDGAAGRGVTYTALPRSFYPNFGARNRGPAHGDCFLKVQVICLGYPRAEQDKDQARPMTQAVRRHSNSL